jgi:DNA-binding IclR family transcriptional regulator
LSQALAKGLELLSLVGEGSDTLSKLVTASGLPKSTVHRLTAVLVSHGLLRSREHHFVLGHRLLELSEKARRQLHYLAVARPFLEAVSMSTSETVHLGELSAGHIVYVEKVEGMRNLQLRSHIGLRSPAQTTALGKVLIASLPREEWEQHLLDLPPRPQTSNVTKKALLAELEIVRSQGYALDREENEPGTRCVAAPIWNASGKAVAAMSISGASVYITPERQASLIPVVLDCANTISKELGAEVASAGGKGRHEP